MSAIHRGVSAQATKHVETHREYFRPCVRVASPMHIDQVGLVRAGFRGARLHLPDHPDEHTHHPCIAGKVDH